MPGLVCYRSTASRHTRPAARSALTCRSAFPRGASPEHPRVRTRPACRSRGPTRKERTRDACGPSPATRPGVIEAHRPKPPEEATAKIAVAHGCALSGYLPAIQTVASPEGAVQESPGKRRAQDPSPEERSKEKLPTTGIFPLNSCVTTLIIQGRSSRPIKIRTTSHTPTLMPSKCADRVGPASPFRADPVLMPLIPGLAPWAFLLHPCGVRVDAHPTV
ncbi:MAG: hypothetical protein H6Q05_237 [Acidobacteria bacterium]|nr:hypothetical protein [Acidobacteriota bacterium]